MHRSRLTWVAATLSSVLVLGVAAFAGEGHQHGKPAADKSKKAVDKTIVCPVMNMKVAKSRAVPVVYKDKKYYLCCKMCMGTFNKNPQKYIKAAAKYADPIKPAKKGKA